jgi:hypothetical protein
VFIIEILQNLPATVDIIARMTKVDDTVFHLPRDENIIMARFAEEMEHVFKSMIKIKNQL